MPMEQGKVSEQVKDLRKRLGMSQKEMADALGVSFATVNRWENGKTIPSSLALNQFKIFRDQQLTKRVDD